MEENHNIKTETMKNKSTNWKKLVLLISIILLITIAVGIKIVLPGISYNKAMELYESGNYEKSIEAFHTLGDYKDSKEMILTSKYDIAMSYYVAEDYDVAIAKFEELGSYSNCENMINNCHYFKAVQHGEEKDWDSAIEILTKIQGYSDSTELIQNYTYEKALEKAENKDWISAIEIMTTIPDYKDSNGLIRRYTYNLGVQKAHNQQWDEAIEIMTNLIGYMDSDYLVKKYTYDKALKQGKDQNWDLAIQILSPISEFKNSNELIRQYKINKILKIDPILPEVYNPPSNPVSIEEFEELLLFMAINNITELKVDYDKFLNNNYIEIIIEDNVSTAFLNLFYKYPESFSNFDNIYTFDRTVSDNTSIELKFVDSAFTDTRIPEMIRAFREESYNIIEKLIEQNKITKDMTSREKAKLLYIWMAHNLKYDTKYSSESYTGYGAAINRKAVCHGYTALYNMLCKIVGIEVEGVTGTVGNEGHLWTYANLDGKNVYIDTTWGDPTPDTKNYCDMRYFAVSEEFLRKTHNWE